MTYHNIMQLPNARLRYFGNLFESDLGLGAPAVLSDVKAGGHPTLRALFQVSFKSLFLKRCRQRGHRVDRRRPARQGRQGRQGEARGGKGGKGYAGRQREAGEAEGREGGQ